MTTEERLQMEVNFLREKVKELQDNQVGLNNVKKYLKNRVVLGLCFAIPHLNCKTAQSVVDVMTCKELSEFAIALDESEVNDNGN